MRKTITRGITVGALGATMSLALALGAAAPASASCVDEYDVGGGPSYPEGPVYMSSWYYVDGLDVGVNGGQIVYDVNRLPGLYVMSVGYKVDETAEFAGCVAG